MQYQQYFIAYQGDNDIIITDNTKWPVFIAWGGVGGSEDLEGYMVIAVCHSRSSQWQLWNLNYKKQNELFSS